jgi:tagatose-1,6-bisphosphate aldolase non-catalytic subunit AgaZ/GatZ
MNDNRISQVVQFIKKMNEKVTLLGIGPMSQTIIDASLECSMANDFPLFFIASRNQIEKETLGGGYVEDWNQYGLSSYVHEKTKEIGYKGLVFKCRDHGGPWQRDDEYAFKLSEKESISNALESFKSDLNAGFELIHVDTSKDPYCENLNYMTAVKRVTELVKNIEQYRLKQRIRNVSYEVSLEETNGEFSVVQEFETFVNHLIKEIDRHKLPRPVFMVGNTGTLTRMDKNIGKIDPVVVTKLHEITSRHNLILKEHNADYLDDYYLRMHPQLGIGMSNVAPEFGKLETEALLSLAYMEENYIKEHSIEKINKSNLREVLFAHVKQSGKWKKWIIDKTAEVDFEKDSELKQTIIMVNGHYFYNKTDVTEARRILYKNIEDLNILPNAEYYVKANIKNGIQRYVDAFNLKNLTSKIMEYQSYELAKLTV